MLVYLLIYYSIISIEETTTGLSVVSPRQSEVVALGHTHYWNCSLDEVSRLPISYRWRMNDAFIMIPNDTVMIYGNGTLKIESMSEELTGEYQCVVEVNGESFYSQVVQLLLADIDEIFNLSPSDCHTYIGQGCEFSCTINSNPPASITWLRDGYPVAYGTVVASSESTSKLLIENSSYEHLGEYRCQAINLKSGDIRISSAAVLNATGPPNFLESAKPAIALVGSSAQLDCKPSSNPQAIMTWKKQGLSSLPITSKYQTFLNGTMIIHNVNSNDEGYYTCTAYNLWGTASQTLLLEVIANPIPPMFTVKPYNTTLVHGSSESALCLADGIPKPDIVWINTVGTQVNPSFSPYAGYLNLSSLTVSDSGQWSCKASNIAGVISTSFYITVLNKPEILSTSEQIVVTEGASLQLYCICVGHPQPTIKWRLSGERTISSASILGGYVLSSNGTLTISKVKRDDHGEQRCICENEAGTAYLLHHLAVQYPPSISPAPRDLEILLGEDVTISCPVNGVPLPTVQWYRNLTAVGDLIISNDAYVILTNSSLVMLNVKANMKGMYTCIARNSVGMDVKSFTFTILSPPEVMVSPSYLVVERNLPVILHCTVESTTPVTVSWLNGGLPILEDSNTQVLANYSIVIKSFKESQYGNYSCLASNVAGYSIDTAIVTHQSGPYWIIKPSNASIPVGGTVSLSCRTSSLFPVSYKWLYQQKLSAPANLVQGFSSSGSLTLEFVTLSQMGYYTCIAQDSSNATESTAFLYVFDRPQLVSKSDNMQAVEKDRVILSCEFNSSGSQQNVTWYTPSDQVYSFTSEISISDITVEEHWGNWRCVGCNEAGCTSEVVPLHVAGIPHLYNNRVTSDDNRVIITCSTKGSPAPQLFFYTSRTNLLTSSLPGHTVNLHEYSITLTINRSDLKDSYKCVAVNSFGSDDRDISRPLKVPNLYAQTTSTSLTLRWGAQSDLFPAIQNYRIIINTEDPSFNDVTTLSSNSTSFSRADLQPAMLLNIIITAENQLGESEELSITEWTKSDTPSEPMNLVVSKSSALGAIVINWDQPAELNGKLDDIEYQLDVKSAGDSWGTMTRQTTAVFYLPAAQTYNISIRSVNLNAYSGNFYSSLVSKQVAVAADDVIRLESVVSNLTATMVTSTRIKVTWIPMFGIKQYKIRYAMLNGQSFSMDVVGVYAVYIMNLTIGREYIIDVAGVNDAGIGVFSPGVGVTLKSTEESKDSVVSSGQMEERLSINPNLSTLLAIIFGSVLLVVIIVAFIVLKFYSHNRRLQRAEKQLDLPFDQYKVKKVEGDYKNSMRSLKVYEAQKQGNSQTTISTPPNENPKLTHSKRRTEHVASIFSKNQPLKEPKYIETEIEVDAKTKEADRVFQNYKKPASSNDPRNKKSEKKLKYPAESHIPSYRLESDTESQSFYPDISNESNFTVELTGEERAVDVEDSKVASSTPRKGHVDKSYASDSEEVADSFFALVANLESDIASSSSNLKELSRRKFIQSSQTEPYSSQLTVISGSLSSLSRRRPVDVTDNSSSEADINSISSI